ncbi:MAG: chaperone modulator CbpM [Bacteroidota bacterium]
MKTENLIPVDQFCRHYNIEFSFIDTLHEFGLLQLTEVEEIRYIYPEQITDLERIMHLHYELDINFEGIDAISHLLQRVDQLQNELINMKNRLRLYEPE